MSGKPLHYSRRITDRRWGGDAVGQVDMSPRGTYTSNGVGCGMGSEERESGLGGGGVCREEEWFGNPARKLRRQKTPVGRAHYLAPGLWGAFHVQVVSGFFHFIIRLFTQVLGFRSNFLWGRKGTCHSDDDFCVHKPSI